MYPRMEILSKAEYDTIHENTLRIFSEVGVAVHSEKALMKFKAHDIKVENGKVFFAAKDIENAIKTAPKEFTIHARNPAKNVTMGGENLVIAPGYGSPFVVEKGEQRRSVLADYINFCKLVQTSGPIDMNGMLMGDPSDVPPEKAHLDMVHSNILYCDKPFVGSSASEEAAQDTMEMAGMIWGGKDKIRDKPVTMGIISSLSPLQYASEMIEALMVYAEYGQVNMCALLSQAGCTAPVTLPGLLATQNAEILTGILLAQLVRPGSPVIYGTTSTSTEMRTGALAVGAPELSLIQNATQQMGRYYYGIPTRGSGGITDSHCLDTQAGVESAFALMTTVMSGANFILHGCGILGAYIGMSLEKFISDEEICGMLRRMLQPMNVTDERIDFDAIKTVGPGGEYLTHPSTFKHCRSEFYMPLLHQRNDYSTWVSKGRPELSDIAEEKVKARLEGYQKPEIDEDLEKRLDQYVMDRKS